jgi:hypothetical protein
MNKKAQIDPDILMSPGFVILAALAVGATVAGYFMGRKWGVPSFPIWQLIVIIVGELIAAYIFAARG